MKILILANFDLGLYKFRKELIEKFLNQGHLVYISLPNGKLVRPLEHIGCVLIDTPVDRRGINPITDFSLFLKYRKMMKEINPDLVITYTIKPNIYGGIAARLAKKKYAVNITGLGTAFENSGVLRAIVVNLYKIALKKAKVIFFENSNNRDNLVSFGCCKREQTCVLNGAGVNTLYYNYLSYPRNDIVKFLFVGRVMKEKGIDELFDSMKRLVAEGQSCFLDVVGPFEEDYKTQLAKYETEGWLKYHGYQEDVRPFIKDCDCFVLPSYHEGMANTNLECASSGRPIITSNIPGCKEAVIPGKSGFLCEPKDANSLYIAMKHLIDSDNREEMGKFGRNLMIEKFDKKIVVEATVEQLK
ncbi:MAG: glycosyltransferase family 4 protein [Clostridiales bacterium]|nr:glycosyltransferase family 4 protein [Clostridiales bacterium]